MARRKPFHRPPGIELGDRALQRKAAQEKRQALFARMAEDAARKASATSPLPAEPERPARNVDAYMNALASQPLYRLGEASVVELTPTYLRLVRSAAEVASDGSAQVVMCWPPAPVSPSAIVSLLAIAAVASADLDEAVIQNIRSSSRKHADEVRAVIFPYARSTHAQARQVQVDRNSIGDVNFDHLKRYMVGTSDPAKDYHQVLSCVRHLNGRALDGRDYTEFEHPILDEFVPHGPPRGERPANSALLWRTQRKTEIAKQSRSGEADDPAKAPYYMYTVRRDDCLEEELHKIKRPPHLLVLDLSRAARSRLGWNWLERAAEMIRNMRDIHPTAGILAVADDPWTYRAARFDILGTRQSGRKAKVIPVPGHVAISPMNGIVQDAGQQPILFEGGGRIDVDGFFGEVGRNIERLRSLAHRLRDAGDIAGAERVKNLIAIVRRSACLPGSIEELSRFLETETTTAIASDRLSAYRSAGVIATLDDPRSLASQVDVDVRSTAETAVLMRSLERETPMASMLEVAMLPALRSSSRSVFIFRSDMVAEFAADRFAAMYPKLGKRLESDVIRFGGERVLSTVTAAPNSSRNQFKRAIVVAPARSAILKTLTEPWLPEQVCILADADTLAFAARDAESLASELKTQPLVSRMRAFAKRAMERVVEIGRHTVQFDPEPYEEGGFPVENVVDLTSGRRGEKRLVEIKLGNGQRIIARPSTDLVLRDDAAATTSFVERPASQLRIGDEVCVIGTAFIERARTLLNVRATAAAEIREYHQLVLRRFAEIPDATIAGRLRTLTRRMGEPRVPVERARYWINLEDEIEKAAHEVIPHAPQDRDTFLRFTAALDIGQRLAESFWRWAVVAQRSHRLRSGNVFHDAFRGILTDPHSALADNRDRRNDIRLLRAMADEHVATVVEICTLEAG